MESLAFKGWFRYFFSILILLLVDTSYPSGLTITEFMASNSRTLADEDGDYSDWIEITNNGATAQSLLNWCLTDSSTNRTKWRFPDLNLDSGDTLIVFASDKDRRIPGKPLHTNFKLSADGEYLALIMADGTTVASEFAPSYPPQVPDVSFGYGSSHTSTTMIGDSAPSTAFVPTDSDLGLTWTGPSFEDGAWMKGTTGIGYEKESGFETLIGLNSYTAMYGKNQSIYIRIPFQAANPSIIKSLTLRMKYDDGFVAYINSEPVADRNAPDEPAWSSGASTYHEDSVAVVFEDIDITAHKGAILSGTNVLSIHGLNWGISSSDFLMLPQLVADVASSASPEALGYFLEPTPDDTNDKSSATIGPLIFNATHTPVMPSDNDAVWVTTLVQKSLQTVASVTLHYRVMFGPEVSTTMLDDGQHQDGNQGDGVYGASIPAALSQPGQMVRYYITTRDIINSESRLPLFLDPAGSPEYLGTVISDPSIVTELPVYHWFVQDTAGADDANQTGARASLFYNGVLYDNIFVRVRGATASQVPKKPYKFDFNRGYHFNYMEGKEPVEEINLNSTFQDKAYIRPVLTFETYRNSGVAASQAFPVRLHRNGTFFSLALAVEQVDEDFLEQRDLDPEGALYKIFNGLTDVSAGTYEKKTRKDEGITDLQQFVNAIQTAGTVRNNYLMDNLDIPSVINYLASGVISQDWDRAIKNYYLFRDTNGTGEWSIIPWDKDLTFGASGLQSDYITGSDDTGPSISHPFYGDAIHNCCGVNRLFDAIYAHPTLREMFVRRIRSLMDRFLQPPDTKSSELLFENQLDELYPLIEDDAALDLARWGAGWGQTQSLATAFGLLKTNYLKQRRTHLYETHSFPSSQSIIDTGHFSNAAKFSSNSLRKIEVPYLSQFNSSALSAEFWVKIGASSAFQVLLSRAPKGPGHWEIYTMPTTGTLSVYTPDLSPGDAVSSLSITDSQWHFISFRLSSGKVLLFVDGTKVIDSTVSGTIAANSYPIIAGALHDQDAPNNFPIAGMFDDLRISNTSRAMSSVPSTPLASDSATLGLYHFDSLENNAFPDSSSHTNPASPFSGVGEIPGTQPGQPAVMIDSIYIAEATDTQSGDYLRIVNPNEYAVDISHWKISGPIEFEFQPGTVIPATEPYNVLFLSPDVNAFRQRSIAPTGNQGLFIQGDYSGSLNNTGYPVTLEDASGTLISSFYGSPTFSNQQKSLRISELMFDPATPPGDSSYKPGDFEFIEIQNTGEQTINLAGVSFSDGISFTFTESTISSLAPGGYALAVKNRSAFESRYGNELPIAGEYEGGFDKNGEQITLIDTRGGTITGFEYNDGRGWPLASCGAGHSLVPTASALVNEPSGSLYYGGNWRPSTHQHGSPGDTDPEPVSHLVINEISSNSSSAWVELINPTDTGLSTGNLFLAEDSTELNQWPLPISTLQPGETLILNPSLLSGFRLNPYGGKLFLTHIPTTGFINVIDSARYEALEPSSTVGRYPASDSHQIRMTPTQGTTNQPGNPPIILSEMMYHPQDSTAVNLEYIELHNPSEIPVTCGNSVEAWRLSGGIDYTFPTGLAIPGHGSLVVTGFDPTDVSLRTLFETNYGLPDGTITLAGPYTGNLSGRGERVSLEAPVLVSSSTDTIAWAIVDEAVYFHTTPWPDGTDGTGSSIHRLSPHISGNTPSNWRSGPPSPGDSSLHIDAWQNY